MKQKINFIPGCMISKFKRLFCKHGFDDITYVPCKTFLYKKFKVGNGSQKFFRPILRKKNRKLKKI